MVKTNRRRVNAKNTGLLVQRRKQDKQEDPLCVRVGMLVHACAYLCEYLCLRVFMSRCTCMCACVYACMCFHGFTPNK